MMEVFKSVATQGPLVAFLFYLFVENRKIIGTKDEQISLLNQKLLDQQEKSFDKVAAISKDSNAVLAAISEAFKGARNV